jgi:cell division protein ZapA (FtsZ GTPase activity inhibitor)
LNEKVDIEIGRRRLTVEMEGWTPLHIINLAKKVSDKMAEVEAHNSKIADTSKLAILTALDFAAELSRLHEAHDTEKRILENKVEELLLQLQKALSVLPPST